jgi:hypothetical protein
MKKVKGFPVFIGVHSWLKFEFFTASEGAVAGYTAVTTKVNT